jgi:hypothetical protein
MTELKRMRWTRECRSEGTQTCAGSNRAPTAPIESAGVCRCPAAGYRRATVFSIVGEALDRDGRWLATRDG